MTEWNGRFSDGDVKATEKHQTASEEERETKFPLPAQVTYKVPRELAEKILARLRKRSSAPSGDNAPAPRLTVPPTGAAKLAVPVVTSVTYLDVGCSPQELHPTSRQDTSARGTVGFGRHDGLAAVVGAGRRVAGGRHASPSGPSRGHGDAGRR